MKRFAYLAVLMALSSPACARDSYSFTVHGHRIHVEADRHCRSLSCVSISIPGVGNWHNRRDRDDDDVATVREPPPAPAPAAAQPAVAQPQARTAPAVSLLPRMVTVPTVVRPQPAPQPAPVQAVPPAPVQIAPVAAPTLAAAPPDNKPVETTSSTTPAPVAQETESPLADSPLGDWQSDGKNPTLVHIEACGHALCGYVLDDATRAMGEGILVNMKPKGDARWSGNVYSRTSGNSYYGTMTLKQADTLRVEACALGKFLCSGNNWTRLQPKPHEVVTTDHARLDPRS